MPMTSDELTTQMLPRAQRLGLIDPQTGYIDRSEIAAYIAASVRYLANRYQLQHYLEINRELLRTVSGVESYTLPANYGFWAPEETRRSGLAATNSDGTQTSNLEYYDPARFNLYRTTNTGKPSWFTVAQNLIYFQPIPDAVYLIEAIERPVQTGADIPDVYAAAVEIETLWRMASDQGKATPLLGAEHVEIVRTLVNNESRFRQRFYTSRERIGLGRRSKRYGL